MLTKQQLEKEAEMHRAIRKWFETPDTIRPTCWDLGDEICKIAQKGEAPFRSA